jgi:phthalate 4,5-dioxygenase
MLTREQNELVTSTNAGTPGGDLMRRFWQPVALAEELSAGAPVAVRLLGEDLVLFRADDGTPALVGLHCPHRGADLSFGRLENGGLRCLYHGWLVAPDGRCLEQPGEPAQSTFAGRVRHTAYRCADANGLILAYLGPGEPPLVPRIPALVAPPENVWCTKFKQDCNYLQALEGNFDPQHVSFLHRINLEQTARRNASALIFGDGAPAIDVEETPFGVRIYARRAVSADECYVRVTNFLMPNCSAFTGIARLDPKTTPPDENDGHQLNWHVPIDDTHHWKYVVVYRYGGPVDRAYLERTVIGNDTDSSYKLRRNARNRYLQNRDEMKDATFIGMGHNFMDHDRFATESQGAISDRTREHLGVTDRAIVVVRRQLLEAIDAVRAGRDPLAVNRDPAQNPHDEVVVRTRRLPGADSIRGFWRREQAVAAGG